MEGAVYDLLYACTCRVIAGRKHGTGFFVSPGRVLTCAHVIKPDGEPTPVRLQYRDRLVAATVEACLDSPYPDLALLAVDAPQHPCVALDPQVESQDLLFAFGYPPSYLGGDSVLTQYEGPGWLDAEQTQPLLKMRSGQVVQGLSGAPVLNTSTWAVCGVVKSTRDAYNDLGGRAIPIHLAIDLLDLSTARPSVWTRAVEQQISSRRQTSRTVGPVDVVLFEHPDNTFNRPSEFVGRRSLMEQIGRELDRGSQVLLYGLAGAGKTALAATVADKRLEEGGGGSYLWISAEHASADLIIEAVVRQFVPLEAAQAITELPGQAKLRAVRKELERSSINCVVVDNVWKPQALFEVLRALPQGMPALVTSRYKLDLPAVFEVGDLETAEAIRLLMVRAGVGLSSLDAEAERLCKILGRHAYAIELAGSNLRQHALTPGELLEEIAAAPHQLAMPNAFSGEGRQSLKRLLDASYNALPDGDSRDLLTAFGGLFTGGGTVELFAAYLKIETARIRRALGRLVGLSLVRRREGTAYYNLHDVTWSYSRELFAQSAGSRSDVVRAIVNVAQEHQFDHALLAQEMPNLMGAADAARRDGDDEAFLTIVSSLALGGFVDLHGHSNAYLAVLGHAIQLLRSSARDPSLLHHLLCKRGNAFYNRGEIEEAVRSYGESLEVAPDWKRTAIMSAVQGKAMARLGRFEESKSLFAAAYMLVKEHDDPRCLVRVLEQESDAASRQEDFDRVRDLAMRAVAASREVKDPNTEAYSLTNLGCAELDIGLRRAVAHHREALRIATEVGDEHLLAWVHRVLGVDYHGLEDFDRAKEHLNLALELFARLQHTDGERYVRDLMMTFGYVDDRKA